MIIPVKPGERAGGDFSAVAGPEKRFLVVDSGGDPPARHDAVGQIRTSADRDTIPQNRPEDPGTRADLRVTEDALGGVEAVRPLSKEDTPPPVEAPAPLRERSSALERFERCAQEIARAAEVGKRPLVQHPTDFLPPFVEQRLPQVGNEQGLAGGDPVQQPGRQDADTRIQERSWAVDPERRDAIPFGLKRRVVVRIPIFGDEERCGASRFPMAGEQSGQVGGERRVGIDEEKLVAGQKGSGVPVRTGDTEEPRLREKKELRKARRLLAQVALDLVAEVMKINRYFAEAGLLKPPEVR